MADFGTNVSGGYSDPPGAGGRLAGSAQSGQPVYASDGATNPQQQQRYRFSQEEMRAIRECNKESFYYRCLPIGTLLGCGTYYGVRYGYLKPSARFGAGPKMFIASIVGYFLGKMSYQSVCAEKLMALPNSQLGEVLRKQKGKMGFQETLSLEPGFASAAPVGGPAFSNSEFNRSQTHSDMGDTRPISNFDNESSSNSGYDYSNSSYDTTQQMLDDENLPPKRPQSFTSYDNLRRQNRIEYETKQHTPMSPGVSGATPNSSSGGYESLQSRRGQSYLPNENTAGKPRNKYGDVWDDKPSSY